MISFYFCKDCKASFSIVMVDDSIVRCYRCNSHDLILTKTVTGRRTHVRTNKKQSPDLPNEDVMPCDELEGKA
jgi:DNA-directed RNA polymerase subunit RPC12/RpoP